jgi:hypothetical protein
MSFSFSGPSPDLSYAMAGGAVVGVLYSTIIAKTNPWPIPIFVMRELADSLFYHLARIGLRPPNDRSAAQLYVITNLTANVATLLVLRQMELIGNIGTVVFASLMAIEMICKCADFSKYRIDRIG